MGVAALFGMHGWGFMHSGFAVLALLVSIPSAFWLLGFVPFFKLSGHEPTSDQPPVA
jgi:hypothetical protein